MPLDRRVLGRAQAVGVEPPRAMRPRGVQQRIRADEAPDMLGAEGGSRHAVSGGGA